LKKATFRQLRNPAFRCRRSRRGGSNSIAVTAELDRAKEAQPLQDSIQAWRDANPFPPPTELKADKVFFDELSGEP